MAETITGKSGPRFTLPSLTLLLPYFRRYGLRLTAGVAALLQGG